MPVHGRHEHQERFTHEGMDRDMTIGSKSKAQ
jgi:hypothetical protein